MVRFVRVVMPDVSYHLTHRGNRREDVFFDEEDRRIYLAWLRGYCEEYALEVWAWCLMSNHVHLLVVPRKEDSLAQRFRNSGFV